MVLGCCGCGCGGCADAVGVVAVVVVVAFVVVLWLSSWVLSAAVRIVMICLVVAHICMRTLHQNF